MVFCVAFFETMYFLIVVCNVGNVNVVDDETMWLKLSLLGAVGAPIGEQEVRERGKGEENIW